MIVRGIAPTPRCEFAGHRIKYFVLNKIDHDCIETLDEFEFSIDRAIRARASGLGGLAFAHAKTAEELLRIKLPRFADIISCVSSRKGNAAEQGATIANNVIARDAARVAALWLIRAARAPALHALNERYASDQEFQAVFRALFSRLLHPQIKQTN